MDRVKLKHSLKGFEVHSESHSSGVEAISGNTSGFSGRYQSTMVGLVWFGLLQVYLKGGRDSYLIQDRPSRILSPGMRLEPQVPAAQCTVCFEKEMICGAGVATHQFSNAEAGEAAVQHKTDEA